MAFSEMLVSFTDGRSPETVRVTPRQHVALERQFGISLADANRVEHMYYLGYIGLHQSDRFPGTFDEFLTVVEEIDSPEAQVETDPTPPAQSQGDLSV